MIFVKIELGLGVGCASELCEARSGGVFLVSGLSRGKANDDGWRRPQPLLSSPDLEGGAEFADLSRRMGRLPFDAIGCTT